MSAPLHTAPKATTCQAQPGRSARERCKVTTPTGRYVAYQERSSRTSSLPLDQNPKRRAAPVIPKQSARRISSSQEPLHARDGCAVRRAANENPASINPMLAARPSPPVSPRGFESAQHAIMRAGQEVTVGSREDFEDFRSDANRGTASPPWTLGRRKQMRTA